MDNDGVSRDFPRHEVYAPDTDERSLVYVLSWTAYARLLFALVVRIVLFMLAYTLAIWVFKIKHTDLLAKAGVYVMFALPLAWTVYDFLYLRTMKLYVDQRGVWLYQGLFPWATGLHGARWEQIGEASFTQSFLSWAFKSYSVCVTHRYTGAAEIFVPHIRDGHIAVQTINQLLATGARTV